MILRTFSLDSQVSLRSELLGEKKSDAFKKIIPCLGDILALSTATLFPTLLSIKRKKNFVNFVFKTFNVENVFFCFLCHMSHKHYYNLRLELSLD